VDSTSEEERSRRVYSLRHEQRIPTDRAIEGYRGEYLLRREVEVEDGVELLVLTLWESMEAVRRFAGAEPDKAVVEPEARAVLTSFDEFVTHYEVVQGTDCQQR
jgi:heme-degrading monooxygenase HmoA